jgi:hypothetical protein
MLTMKNSLITLLVLILTSCQNEKKEFQPILVEESVVAIINEHEGKKLMETHCYLCHSPNADENQGRIAPPMVAIKARYIDKERYTKEEFIAAVASFVENPTEDKALMYGALKKHGLMPKQAFPPESVKIIDNASDAIIYIGENYENITHYSLDYDLSYGEKGTQVAEFLSQQGNTGHNVWIHSGNVDSRDEFLAYLPDAKLTPSNSNVDAIANDIKANLY